MSRLPTLSTPGRLGTPSATGLPTPTMRRPRSSLGPTPSHMSTSTTGDEMDRALEQALRTRPPSSLRVKPEDDQASPSYWGSRTPGPSSLGPRTPSVRAHTPSTSRTVSRSSVRPSITGTNTFTPRRVSMAQSTSTPNARRPESRASALNGDEPKFIPQIGDRVRIQSMGMEGTLRYIGETEFKAGTWAGIELGGGFVGKGKNDGSVNGVPYFSCGPNCGVFVLATKLSPPTSGPSRPVSVASHRSLASSHASFPLSGRATPSERARPPSTTPGRPPSTTPARNPRSVLGTSTSTNATMIANNITAGSRASKYLGMTAKQLDSVRASGLNASVKHLRESTMTTPKPSRMSFGGAGVTPVRPRSSVAGGFVTPKPRVPRASAAVDMMPPPPSPGQIGRALASNQTQLEDEVRELRRRNAELEEELKSAAITVPSPSAQDAQRTQALQDEIDRVREEAESLRSQLDAVQTDAAEATKLAEELQVSFENAAKNLEEKEREIESLRHEIIVVEERTQGELDAGMEAKREEVRLMLERAEMAEQDGAEMRALVEELTQAGQATISLYETKQYDLEDKIRLLEEKTRLTEDKLAKAREEVANAAGVQNKTREATTAAEIDNETLNAQVQHLQQKLSNLEEDLDEARNQIEIEAESWKARLAKAKDGERAVLDRERELKEEIKRLQKAAEGAKTRIAELESALKENNSALEAARAEIEGLRGEASEASSMRVALQDAATKEKALAERSAEAKDLKAQLAKIAEVEGTIAEVESKLASVEVAKAELETKNGELESKIATLEPEIALLRSAGSARAASPLSSTSTKRDGGHDGSPIDEGKRLRGFQHIINELSNENGELKEKYESVLEEVSLLKEEVKLLEEANAIDGQPKGSSAELAEARATIEVHVQSIKELNREVGELESLVESKIYREDDLETRLLEAEREIKRLRTSSSTLSADVTGHSRKSSTATSVATNDRCELCEGPHDLDACPVFAGNMDGDDRPSPLLHKGKFGKWCADCENADHDTAECPNAEDVF